MENSQNISKGIGRYIPVYVALLALSGLQIFLAYTKLDRNRLLAAFLPSQFLAPLWQSCISCT